MSTFDRYSNSYKETVQSSIDFIGQEVDFFTERKAQHLLDVASRHVGPPRSLRLLDVGCGIGLTDAYLAPEVGELSGVDMAEGAIETARSNNRDVSYSAYDGKILPHPPNTFDVVFAICVLHHVPPVEWPSFLSEMRRVCRSGGMVVIFEHNPLNPLTRLAVARCAFDEDAVLLGRKETRRLLGLAGLSTLEQRFIIFFPRSFSGSAAIERALGAVPAGAQYYVAARKVPT